MFPERIILLKSVKLLAGLIPTAGLALGAHYAAAAHVAPSTKMARVDRADQRKAARTSLSEPGIEIDATCWTIDASHIRIYESPDVDPYFTTKKGQEFVTSGGPVSAGGKEWYEGYDAAYSSPPTGWIARNYLTKRTC